MADATKFPTLAELIYFQWSRPASPNPRLSAPIDADDTTIFFTSAPQDEDGTIITTPFLMGIKNNESFTELIFCANGADGTSGLSATGCVRGIEIAGTDFTVGGTTFAAVHEQDAPIFCSINAVMNSVMVEALQGNIATGGTGLIIGTDALGTVTVSRSSGVGTNLDWLRFNNATGKAQFSNDGVVFTNFDTVSASNLVVVTNNDTTPGVLNDKVISSSGRITTAVANPAADEDLDFDLAMTASDAEINQALDGISANVTVANLNTLTAGPTSNADALHTHLTSAVSVTTAEAIDGSTTPQAVSLMGNNFKDNLIIEASGQTFFSINTGTKRTFGDVDATTRIAQSFTFTDAEATAITLETLIVLFDKIAAPGDNVTIEIQLDSAGDPDGTAITDGTSVAKTGGSLSTDEQPVEFTWSTPPTLTSGQKYWAVLRRSGANNGTNHYAVRDANADVLAGQTAKTFTSSTQLWADLSRDLQMIFLINKDYDGDILKSDANESRRGNFAGFTKSNVGSGVSAELIGENFIDGFTGLSAGAIHYVDTTAGAITTSAPAVGKGITDPNIQIRVGKAVKTDTLEIQTSFRRLLEINAAFSSGQPMFAGTSGTATFDIFIPCGFRPEYFEVRYSRNQVEGTGADDRFVTKKYVDATVFEFMFIEPIPFGSIATIDLTTEDIGMKIISIQENGYTLRFSSQDTTEDMIDISIIASTT